MKRKIVTAAAIIILSTAAIFAANANGSFKAVPIVNVSLNETKVISDTPGILLGSRTLLPLRAVAEAMNSIIYRIAVYDPKGLMIKSSAVQSEVIGKDGLIAYIPVEHMTYSLSGNYSFQFQIKSGSEFRSIGETIAVVK